MIDKTTSRRPRADKGSIQLTPRDLRVLSWIAEQYAVRADQVQELLSPSRDELISETRLRQIIARWAAGGWIEQRRWLVGEPAYLWINGRGLSMIGLNEFKAAPPAATRLRHLYAINEVRLHIERLTADRKRYWWSERWVRTGLDTSKKGTKIGPIPDGEVIFEDRNVTCAVEVELSTKKRDDLLSKIQALCYKQSDSYDASYHHPPYYSSVWVFVPTEALESRVLAAREKLRKEDQERIFVYRLDSLES